MLAGSLVVQVLRLEAHLYRPANNPYPEVAAYLKSQNIHTIATTASLALLPYASEELRVQLLMQAEAFDTLYAQGIEYLLIDDFYRVAHLQAFDTLAAMPVLRTWSAAHWGRTMLHLEHSEFTGKSFQDSWEAARQLTQKPPQLRLVALPQKANDAARKSDE